MDSSTQKSKTPLETLKKTQINLKKKTGQPSLLNGLIDAKVKDTVIYIYTYIYI